MFLLDQICSTVLEKKHCNAFFSEARQQLLSSLQSMEDRNGLRQNLDNHVIALCLSVLKSKDENHLSYIMSVLIPEALRGAADEVSNNQAKLAQEQQLKTRRVRFGNDVAKFDLKETISHVKKRPHSFDPNVLPVKKLCTVKRLTLEEKLDMVKKEMHDTRCNKFVSPLSPAEESYLVNGLESRCLRILLAIRKSTAAGCEHKQRQAVDQDTTLQ